jgi:hypothetical protein
MKPESDKRKENNPETGLNNVFRENDDLPREAGDKGATSVSGKPVKDRGNMGKEGSMEDKYDDEEGADTMDGESDAV